MRRPALALFLLLSACSGNLPALKSAQAAADQLLLERKEEADLLNPRRHAAEVAETKLEAALAVFPMDAAVRQAVAAMPVPTMATAVASTPPALPPVGRLESGECQRARLQLSDTLRRVADLERVVAEARLMEARRVAFEARLARVAAEPAPR